jgi:hypothetical protein
MSELDDMPDEFAGSAEEALVQSMDKIEVMLHWIFRVLCTATAVLILILVELHVS